MVSVASEQKFHMHSIDQAIQEIKNGRMIIVVDDENRENEGDLIIPAEKVTPDAINFMATHGKGLICIALTKERIEELQIPMMISDKDNKDKFGTAFTISVDAKHDTTTGISSFDRSKTIHTLIAPQTKPQDLLMPGHMFPLRAHSDGVLARAGHTEAAVDFAQLAGLFPAGVICEIMASDGTMARLPELQKFADKHNLKIFTIAELIEYRRERK
ncbi:3,4-dihydroxy-2-butanone-4-phosphate synthase [Candidatus Uabimicrobium helgolandensis]